VAARPRQEDRRDRPLAQADRAVGGAPHLFGHDPERWPEFTRRYREDLTTPERSAALERLREAERTSGTVTLLFAARDETHNHAAALLEVLNEGRANRRR
jgi:uncharacterized protein YeaO (DUF488 family)